MVILKPYRAKKSLRVLVLIVFVLISGSIFSKTHADVPLAARLLSVPYNDSEIGGLRVTVNNFSDLRGITNDGTTVYLMNGSGNIATLPMNALVGSPGGTVAVNGTLHTVGWGSGGVPSFSHPDGRSLAYSHGCLFITDDASSYAPDPISLYCIDTSDWSVTQITVPADEPLPQGHNWGRGTVIDFADGRIGKVSAYASDGEGGYTSYLRMYTVTGTGKSATIAWSHDYFTHDTENWNTDEHGVATDGTYLYRIEFIGGHLASGDFKSWPLDRDTSPNPVYAGLYTVPNDGGAYNVTYLSHDHTGSRYLFGGYSTNHFYITSAADPGPGPGNPLTPTFGTITSTVDGYTVQITNYDATFDWSFEATSGSVSVSETGFVTVTGLGSGASSTVTVSTVKTNFPNGSADVTGTALADDGDGVNAAVEDAAPNGGDGNNDSTLDSEQSNVTSLPNTIAGEDAYMTVQVDGETCSALSNVSVESASNDRSYRYPIGLLNFNTTCTSGSSTTVTIYYDHEYDTSRWTARKYVNGSYTTIPGATFGTANIGGATVTTLTYTLTDGSALDTDGVENGTIVDPVGPGVRISHATIPTSPSVTYGCKDSNALNYDSSATNNQQDLCTYKDIQTPPTSQTPASPPTATPRAVCSPYLKSYIEYGAKNDPEEVKKLQEFLNEKQGEHLVVDGVYSIEDRDAVQRFQQKYASEVLNIWDLHHPTGYVYRTTLMKINSFYCSQAITCPAFIEYNSLTKNTVSDEVGKTKTLLHELGFYSGTIDNTFDASLTVALKKFQEDFSNVMLKPWNLGHGTGYKYKTTNKFLNMLVGCKTSAVELDGKGVFDY